jgi:hypothetical protein
MSLQANLEKAIAGKKKAPAAAPADAVVTPPAVSPTSEPAAVPADTKVKKSRVKKAAAPTQAEIDADRARLMGANSESTVKKDPVIAESFSLYRKH